MFHSYIFTTVSNQIIQYVQTYQSLNIMNQEGAREVEQERRKQEEQYNTFMYKFEQQIIDAWKPVPYTRNNVILYSVLTAVCVAIGLALILTAPQTPEYQIRYDDATDADQNNITAIVEIKDTLPQPVYFYYGFTNYYQNHRRYLKYFSPDQMNGRVIDETTARKACGDQAYSNQQIGATTSISGTALDPAAVAFPCGQRAKSYLKLKPQIDSIRLLYSNGTDVTLNRKGVAWPDDPSTYKDSSSPNSQAISNTDEAWLVWFRPAAKNYFYKLHSRIQSDLPAGNYSIKVTDYFDVSFGQKNFYISKSNYMGNKDYFLGIAFLVLGGGCLIVLIIFIAKCVTEMRGRPKQS